MDKRSLHQRAILVLAGTVFPAIIYILARSWRIEIINKAEGESRRPVIWAFWHSRMLPLLFAYRSRGIVVLVSQSFDGDIIAKTLEVFGFKTIRGSSSRGGLQSLLQIIDLLKKGETVAFTPDGPRGPREVVKTGLVSASKKSGAPVIPVSVTVRKAWKLKTWDEFVIPKPFSRIEIELFKAILPEQFSADELLKEVQNKLEII